MPSTVIRSFSYAAESRMLTITFVSGARYRYAGVPAEVYADFKKAYSKGHFFSEYIRDVYTYERISP